MSKCLLGITYDLERDVKGEERYTYMYCKMTLNYSYKVCLLILCVLSIYSPNHMTWQELCEINWLKNCPDKSLFQSGSGVILILR